MTFKQDYFQNKFTSHWNDSDRSSMAERDVDTIIYLLRTFYDFQFKKDQTILDLGSGDQFLKDEFVKRGMSYSSLDIKDLDFEKFLRPMEWDEPTLEDGESVEEIDDGEDYVTTYCRE